jgi:hypothetical protein
LKISDLHEKFKDYPKTTVSGKALGCKEEIIRTTTVPIYLGEILADPENLVAKHCNQIKEYIELHQGDTIYFRQLASMVPLMSEDGEIEGYTIKTRIQSGETGKCITQEQYDHISSFIDYS